MSHRPRKRFGQNFLQDQVVIGRIIDAINPQPTDSLVEIGPGLAALTLPLLGRLNQLIAIEIDTDLQQRLLDMPQAKNKLQLVGADALTVDFSQWGRSLRVVGNLPYNISTPLLLHLLHQVKFIRDMHFMLQKEVVSRIAARPGSKAYGRLSIMAQYYCEATFLFEVPPESFYPKPNVDSAILRLVPYQQSPYAEVAFDLLEKVVALAFGMRRKTLANNLKPLFSANQLQDIGINPGMRPEQLTVGDYVHIANAVGNSIKL